MESQDKLTELEKGGVVSGYVYIISGAKGGGIVGCDTLRGMLWVSGDEEGVKGVLMRQGE